MVRRRALPHALTHRAAMRNEIPARADEFLERRIDVIEPDVRDEAIQRGVDAHGRIAEHERAVAQLVRDRLKTRDAARIRGIRLVSPDALIAIALEVVLARAFEYFTADIRKLREQRIAKTRPVAVVAPARVGHYPVEIVERAADQQIEIALRGAQRVV